MNLDGLRPWAGLAGGSLESTDVVVVGIPYCGSAVYRKGAALAPQRIRSLSAAMPPVTEDGKLLTGMHVHDMGDVDAGTDIESGWPKAAVQLSRVPSGALLTVLGGDHCTAIATLTAEAKRHPGLAVLWVDAHPDLCDYAPEELEFIAAKGVLLVSTQELAADPRRSAGLIADRLAGQKVHVSFDIDVLDPAFAPGTEIPSSGGLSTRQALDLLRVATERATVVGLDIVEVSPPFDNGDITTFAALKLIFELWGMSWHARRTTQHVSEGHGKR